MSNPKFSDDGLTGGDKSARGVDAGLPAAGQPILHTVAEFAQWLDGRLVELEAQFVSFQRQTPVVSRSQWSAPRQPR